MTEECATHEAKSLAVLYGSAGILEVKGDYFPIPTSNIKAHEVNSDGVLVDLTIKLTGGFVRFTKPPIPFEIVNATAKEYQLPHVNSLRGVWPGAIIIQDIDNDSLKLYTPPPSQWFRQWDSRGEWEPSEKGEDSFEDHWADVHRYYFAMDFAHKPKYPWGKGDPVVLHWPRFLVRVWSVFFKTKCQGRGCKRLVSRGTLFCGFHTPIKKQP